jgi:hypothetical protein
LRIDALSSVIAYLEQLIWWYASSFLGTEWFQSARAGIEGLLRLRRVANPMD